MNQTQAPIFDRKIRETFTSFFVANGNSTLMETFFHEFRFVIHPKQCLDIGYLLLIDYANFCDMRTIQVENSTPDRAAPIYEVTFYI